MTSLPCSQNNIISIMPHCTPQPYHQRPSRGPAEAGHPVAASFLSATGRHRVGLQGGSLGGGFWRLASAESIPFFSGPPLFLLTFCFTSSGLQQSSWCLHTAPSWSTESASSLLPRVDIGGRIPLCQVLSFQPEGSKMPSEIVLFYKSKDSWLWVKTTICSR